MSRRGAHDLVFVAAELADVRDDLARIPVAKRQAEAVRDVLDRLADAQARLSRQLSERPGVPVSAAADYLSVSEPTVRLWLERDVLDAVAGAKPALVEITSLRSVGRVVADLRARGHDRDWMRAVIDYTHDARERERPEIKQGLDELRCGELGPA